MKSIIKAFIGLSFIVSFNIYAQDSDFTLEDLKTPGMPSATIIGTQVNDINRPKSLKDLEAAVFTNYFNSDQSLTLPNEYALELNPFMLSGMKNFDYRDYVDNEPVKNMWQNLSVSIATTNKFFVKDSVFTNAVGFGVRTIILNGKPSEKASNTFLMALTQNLSSLDINTIVRTIIDKCIEDTSLSSVDGICSCVIRKFEEYELQDSNGNPLTGDELENKKKLIINGQTIIKAIFAKINKNTTKENIKEEFDNNYKKLVAAPVLNNLRQILARVKTDRYGLRWDVNWALALNFPTNDFNYSVVPKWGLWTNLSYQTEDLDNLSFIALGRIIIDNENYINKYQPVNENFTTGNIYDLGIMLDYRLHKFSISIEYLYRLNTNKETKFIEGEEYVRTVKNDTRKYLLNINYNLSDDIVLSYNIGKNFNNIFQPQGDLISGLSINFGFGDIKASDLISSK